MTESTTLDQLSSSQSQKEVLVNEINAALSPAAAFGRRASTCSALTWGYYGGIVDVAGEPTAIANGTLSLAASDTTYIYRTATGTVTQTTTIPADWPGPLASDAVALYEVVTGASTVTSWTDYRTMGGGSGGGGDCKRIAQVVCAGSAATVTFSAIPGTYSNLRVVMSGGDTQSATLIGVRCKVNADGTPGNYTAAINTYGAPGSSPSAASTTNAASADGCYVGQIVGTSGAAPHVGMMDMLIPNYAGGLEKIAVATGFVVAGAAFSSAVMGFVWKSASAITQLDFKTDGTAFSSGTTFTLYGYN